MQRRILVPALLAAGAALGAVAPTIVEADTRPTVQHAELVGRSVLPAATFVPGSEPSGRFITGANGVTTPFAEQPVQGVSAVHLASDGTWWAMSDNGYGAKTNSQDFLLRVHRIRPDTATGVTEVLPGGFNLSDPDRHVPFPIWRDGPCQAATATATLETCPATPDRLLTGWDFDIESMRFAPDGTIWFGEEFGPFLLQTDAAGRLLRAPVPTPGVRAPQNPLPGPAANLGGSKGYEGMAISPDGRTLYPLLEGTVAGDPAGDLRIYEVSIRRGEPNWSQGWFRYRMEHPSNAIGDMTAVDRHRFLVIERDNEQGAAARFKAVFLVDTRDRDRDGYVDKELLVNLLAVPNPGQVGGITDAFFTFPFVTIEGVEVVDERTIAVFNDNNFPFSSGRTPGQPDDNEMILVRLDRDLR